MESTPELSPRTWLDLGEAADYLGVHFTTLRRWADAGEVACIRTPGGRRRFALEDLQAFVAQMRQPPPTAPSSLSEGRALTVARQHIRGRMLHERHWLASLDAERRLFLKREGRRLFALLLQYCSRRDAGEAFLEDGRRIAESYGAICREAGLTVAETLGAFLTFRRSVADSVQETVALNGPRDAESHRLYERMNDFLDLLMLTTVEGHTRSDAPGHGEE